MIGMTLCSGIGAPEMAAPGIDWRFASEIAPFPRAVLQQRFGYKTPEDHNQGDPLLWGDMTEVTPELLRERGIPLPDLIVAGTPCQAFSVAGLRKGLSDARGNLTMKFMEICHAIVDARPDGRLAVVWENVPGVLSDKDNAFGCFLGGIVGAKQPISISGRWPNAGMVSGSRARAAWRVLDAQHFGVPQQRRRVFVVVDFGNKIDPAKVLFERHGVQGDIETRAQAKEEAAAFTQTGIGKWGEGVGTLGASGGDLGVGSESVIVTNSGDKSYCLNAGGMGRQDFETETLIAFSSKDYGNDAMVDVAPTLRVGTLKNGPQPPAIAFAQNSRDEVRMIGGDGQIAGALAARAGAKQQTYIATSKLAVRKLTPTECHRLQGFPDDHCAITYRGKPASDGPKYKALGNSMAVPVVAWILERLRV